MREIVSTATYYSSTFEVRCHNREDRAAEAGRRVSHAASRMLIDQFEIETCSNANTTATRATRLCDSRRKIARLRDVSDCYELWQRGRNFRRYTWIDASMAEIIYTFVPGLLFRRVGAKLIANNNCVQFVNFLILSGGESRKTQERISPKVDR